MSIRIYGNREIKTLPGQLTRPTPSRVREALFNIWQGQISGCRWLDLCAGSGAMGAEALCRGAANVVGIEQSAAACRIIQANWQKVAKPDQTFAIFRGDVLKQLSRLSEKFDRVYFDPPYASGLYTPVLSAIVAKSLLTDTSSIAVEHDPEKWIAVAPPGLRILREKHYGSTYLTFFEPDL